VKIRRQLESAVLTDTPVDQDQMSGRLLGSGSCGPRVAMGGALVPAFTEHLGQLSTQLGIASTDQCLATGVGPFSGRLLRWFR